MSLRAFLLIAAVLTPCQALGQGSLSGTVTDSSGGPLPGVTVSLTREAGPPRMVVTDTAGRYELAGLPGGTYTTMFRLPGFVDVIREDAVVEDNRRHQLDVSMNVGPIENAATLRLLPEWPWPEPPRERACARNGVETASERDRRDEASAAMRLIVAILRTWPALAMPTWEELSASPDVAHLLSDRGSRGDLARRIRWGATEPLPGWGITWAVSRTDLRFALVDLRDAGGFRLSSEDPCVIPPRYRIVPLDTKRQETKDADAHEAVW